MEDGYTRLSMSQAGERNSERSEGVQIAFPAREDAGVPGFRDSTLAAS